MKVIVIYNGIPASFDINPKAHCSSLLTMAMLRFSPPQSLGELSLFDSNGDELPADVRLEGRGVREGATLLMRPLVVR